MFLPRPKIHERKLKDVIKRWIFLVFLNVLSPLIFTVLFWRSNFSNIKLIARLFSKKSIKCEATFTNEEILSSIWNGPVGLQYKDAVEYQFAEGYCSSATTRSVLQSMPIPDIILPEPKYAPSTAENFALNIDSSTQNRTSTEARFYVSYESFVDDLKKSNDPKYRVAVNFLRSSLFGLQGFLPHQLLVGFMGGHFSPIIGYHDKSNSVCIFDVNHNYSCYLVDATRLYDAIAAVDITSGKSRALIVTEILN